MDVVGFAWLSGYVFMNLFTTILNKMLLETYDLPFPSTMSLWHYFCSAVGSIFLVRVMRVCEPATLDWAAQAKLFLFSILFNINILVSTVSLHMVSMALHQIVRALVPAFTVLIMYIWVSKRYTVQVHLSLLTIFLGVAVYALKGELNYTYFGMSLTLFGAFLAAFKTVATNVFMVGPLKLHPLDLLQYMCSYATLQMVVYLWYTGDLVDSLQYTYSVADTGVWFAIGLNGLGAFLLNVVSFISNKKTSPLAMNIGGIAKQVLAIVFGVVWFHTNVTLMSAVGITITCLGIVWYTVVSYNEKRRSDPTADPDAGVKKVAQV